jgi:predicted DNA-binding transcriptional regulator AlpA
MSDLSLKQVADRLGYSIRSAWEDLRSGEFPSAWRRGKRGAWHVPSADVESLRTRRAASLKSRKPNAA